MTTREQLLQAIEQVPESLLDELWEFVCTLKEKHSAGKIEIAPEQVAQPNRRTYSKAEQAFLESLEERQEVYRRLADS